MEYKATITVTGASRNDYDNHFYNEKHEVTADTIGGVLDALVEKSYDSYFQLFLWLIENKPRDYDMGNDYWYVTCSWPSVMNPYNPESFLGAGSSISSPARVVDTVVHYRHMEIDRFMNREVKHMRDGYYNKYVEGVEPLHPFYDVLKSQNVSEFRNYGYTGAQINQVIQDMGEDHINFLKDYAKYLSFITRGTPEKIVIPQREKKATKSKKRFWNLFRA